MTDTPAGDPAAPASPAQLPLFRRAPALQQSLRWTPLARYPTPIEPIEVNGRPLLAKRDDVCADGYAGNKVRKLEFLLADAHARGARRVVTAGATGSHHALATAWHARRLGLDASLVLFPQRLTDHVRDVLLMQAGTGAELRWVRRMEAVPLALWWARQRHHRDRAVAIPPGGSNATGAIGYVNAALELIEQLQHGGFPRPARIHIAAGTLGTVAGLAVGLAWAGVHLPIIATRITAAVVTNQRVLQRLVQQVIARLSAGGAAGLPDADAATRLVELRHDQIGTGYGHATPAGDRAQALFQDAGLHLDATYTAKAAAGLLASPSDDMPLFWHTLSAVEPLELREPGRAVLPPPFARYLERTGPSGR
jgi:D-cysteine desulfhydrase